MHSASSHPPERSVGEAAADGRDAAARALERCEERYRALVERAGYGIYRSSPEGRFVDANPALVALLGYASADELAGLDLGADVFLDPDERVRLSERATGPGFLEWTETRWKRRDGTPITVHIALRAVRGDDGRVLHEEGIVEDVTERLRREELLRRSERMASLGTTLAGVAHELNNPLAAIMGFAQLLLKRQHDAEDRSALETINHEAQRSAKIVRDLLTLARKRETERRAPINVNDIAGYILRTRRYALDTYGIACELRLDPTLPLVRGDRTQLEQVVLNLVTNAEQALHSVVDAPAGGVRGEGPRINVRTWRDAGEVVLVVSDNGPGIPEGAESQIWDPFWTTRAAGEGTGLGLSVVHNIVADHGGSIGVTTTPGGGACFTVRLPALAGTHAPRRDDEPAPRPLDVLVVDGDAADLSFVTRFLTSRGHAVLAASDAGRALRLAEQVGFDAIVCDGALVSESDALVRALCAMTGPTAPRVVVATTIGAPTAAAELLVASLPDGTATVLSKPYDVERLRRAIEEGP